MCKASPGHSAHHFTGAASREHLLPVPTGHCKADIFEFPALSLTVATVLSVAVNVKMSFPIAQNPKLLDSFLPPPTFKSCCFHLQNISGTKLQVTPLWSVALPVTAQLEISKHIVGSPGKVYPGS